MGVALKGCTIYVPWFPCVECTKAIIQSGLSELVAYAPDRPNSNWHEDFSIAGQMLKEAGIEVRLMSRLAELPDASEEEFSEASGAGDGIAQHLCVFDAMRIPIDKLHIATARRCGSPPGRPSWQSGPSLSASCHQR